MGKYKLGYKTFCWRKWFKNLLKRYIRTMILKQFLNRVIKILNKYPLLFFILRRFLSMIPILLIIIFAFFFFMSLAPGDFFTTYYSDPNIDTKTIDYYRNEFALDKPFYIQYLKWLKKVVIDHDLGQSFSYRMPIIDLINTRIWNTVFLNFFSLLFTFLFSYPISFYFAYKPNKILDKSINFISLIFYSFPGFFLALIGLLIASETGLFPITGATSENYESLHFPGKFLDRLHHTFLPIIIGFIGGIAGSLRSMKELLLIEFHKPYILAIKAKGLEKWRIIFHGFRNALIPFITSIAGIFAGLFSGSVFIEIIFSFPGIGRLMYEAALKQDYFLVLTNMIISSTLVLIGIMISDILLAVADPRIRMK
jgi:ABC-type dipeptide/oligopeptide/nickel transport system permease component